MTQNSDLKPVSSGRKRALITGITGQDGSYLAEFLLAKGYEVHGEKFPATLCTSVNEAVVHGIPDDVPLSEGDIVSLDFGHASAR